MGQSLTQTAERPALSPAHGILRDLGTGATGGAERREEKIGAMLKNSAREAEVILLQ